MSFTSVKWIDQQLIDSFLFKDAWWLSQCETFVFHFFFHSFHLFICFWFVLFLISCKHIDTLWIWILYSSYEQCSWHNQLWEMMRKTKRFQFTSSNWTWKPDFIFNRFLENTHATYYFVITKRFKQKKKKKSRLVWVSEKVDSLNTIHNIELDNVDAWILPHKFHLLLLYQ